MFFLKCSFVYRSFIVRRLGYEQCQLIVVLMWNEYHHQWLQPVPWPFVSKHERRWSVLFRQVTFTSGTRWWSLLYPWCPGVLWNTGSCLVHCDGVNRTRPRRRCEFHCPLLVSLLSCNIQREYPFVRMHPKVLVWATVSFGGNKSPRLSHVVDMWCESWKAHCSFRIRHVGSD